MDEGQFTQSLIAVYLSSQSRDHHYDINLRILSLMSEAIYINDLEAIYLDDLVVHRPGP